MVIIPTRLGSSRLPNKPLLEVRGLPLIIRVIKQVAHLDDVYVATDSPEIVKVVKHHNLKYILTSSKPKNGTERVAEAARLLDLPGGEAIINLQGDELNLDPDLLTKINNYISKVDDLTGNTLLVSGCQGLPSNLEREPSRVKVVLNHLDQAIYFSRSAIPFGAIKYWEHIGVYGFTRDSLNRFDTLPRSPLEEIEDLEQLRVLYYGYQIQMIKTKGKGLSINTTQDLINLETGLKDGTY